VNAPATSASIAVPMWRHTTKRVARTPIGLVAAKSCSGRRRCTPSATMARRSPPSRTESPSMNDEEQVPPVTPAAAAGAEKTPVERLEALGVRGILRQLARDGQIIDVRCEMPLNATLGKRMPFARHRGQRRDTIAAWRGLPEDGTALTHRLTGHRSRSPTGCGRPETLPAGCRVGRTASVGPVISPPPPPRACRSRDPQLERTGGLHTEEHSNATRPSAAAPQCRLSSVSEAPPGPTGAAASA
jgi:hypothetical protein